MQASVNCLTFLELLAVHVELSSSQCLGHLTVQRHSVMILGSPLSSLWGECPRLSGLVTVGVLVDVERTFAFFTCGKTVVLSATCATIPFRACSRIPYWWRRFDLTPSRTSLVGLEGDELGTMFAFALYPRLTCRAPFWRCRWCVPSCSL